MSDGLKHCMCGCIYKEADCPNCNKVTDADRIEELEANLEKAVKLAEEALDFNDDGNDSAEWRSIWKRIKELKGQL